MRIERTSQQSAQGVRRKSASTQTEGGGFDQSLNQTAANDTSGVTGGGGIEQMDALLALQEVPDSVAQRSKARKQGQRMLDRMEQLHLELLEGRIAPETVERLAQEVVTAREATDDPDLNEILDEIELRAQVELAKLGR